MRRPLIPAPWSYVLIALAFACLAAYALADWISPKICIFCGCDLDVATIEGNTDVRVPESARDIKSYTEGFQDITTYVRFRIPAPDLPAFLASTGCAEPPVTIALPSPGPNPLTPPWWHPEAEASLIGCTGLEGNTHQTIYIDMSDDQTLSVYLVAAVY